MENLKLDDVFFGVLEVPKLAWANFFYIKAEQSGWLRGVYLTQLTEVYHRCISRVEFTYNARKRQNEKLTVNDIKFTIDDFLKNGNKKTIDKDLLDEMFFAILAAQYIGWKEPDYKPLQVLSFVERALAFIQGEFKNIVDAVAYNYTKDQINYYHYHIFQEAPFFDFIKFKEAVRELNLIQQKSLVFAGMLEPVKAVALNIVKMWNEDVGKFVNQIGDDGEYKQPTIRRLSFNAAQLTITYHNDVKLFELRPFIDRSLFDFTIYAANIVNLISTEILLDNPNYKAKEKKNFMFDLIECIRAMQERDHSSRLEATYRDYVWFWFVARGYFSEMEPLKGTGHIDLKIFHQNVRKKIIEFKVWRNSDKKGIVQQTLKYLTEFDEAGYVFMAQNTQKDIYGAYKALVDADPSTIAGLTKVKAKTHPTYQYYQSKHEYKGKTKTIIHFIFPIALVKRRTVSKPAQKRVVKKK